MRKLFFLVCALTSTMYASDGGKIYFSQDSVDTAHGEIVLRDGDIEIHSPVLRHDEGGFFIYRREIRKARVVFWGD